MTFSTDDAPLSGQVPVDLPPELSPIGRELHRFTEYNIDFYGGGGMLFLPDLDPNRSSLLTPSLFGRFLSSWRRRIIDAAWTHPITHMLCCSIVCD